MEILQTIKGKLSGEPRVTRAGNTIRFTATHRLPSSGDEMVTAFRIIGVVGAVAILVAHYRPEVATDPNMNIFLEFGNMVIAGLLNAVDRLNAVVEYRSLDVPLESLRGWLFALLFLGGIFLFRHSGLFDLYNYLTNREQVKIEIDDENLSVRHSLFRFPKRIARNDIEDILILENHRTGHDVMLQHVNGLTRLASIYGNKTGPTLFKLRLQQALAEAEPSKSVSIGLPA